MTAKVENLNYFQADDLKQAAEFYREQGYLVVLDALSEAEIETLRSEAVAICRGERGEVVLPKGEEMPDASLDDDAFI